MMLDSREETPCCSRKREMSDEKIIIGPYRIVRRYAELASGGSIEGAKFPVVPKQNLREFPSVSAHGDSSAMVAAASESPPLYGLGEFTILTGRSEEMLCRRHNILETHISLLNVGGVATRCRLSRPSGRFFNS